MKTVYGTMTLPVSFEITESGFDALGLEVGSGIAEPFGYGWRNGGIQLRFLDRSHADLSLTEVDQVEILVEEVEDMPDEDDE